MADLTPEETTRSLLDAWLRAVEARADGSQGMLHENLIEGLTEALLNRPEDLLDRAIELESEA